MLRVVINGTISNLMLTLFCHNEKSLQDRIAAVSQELQTAATQQDEATSVEVNRLLEENKVYLYCCFAFTLAKGSFNENLFFFIAESSRTYRRC